MTMSKLTHNPWPLRESVGVVLALAVAACSGGEELPPSDEANVREDIQLPNPSVDAGGDDGLTDGSGPDAGTVHPKPAATPPSPLSWEPIPLPISANGLAWSISGSDAKLWLGVEQHDSSVGYHARVLISADQGKTWQTSYQPTDGYSTVMGVWGVGPREAYAVGGSAYDFATDTFSARIWHTTDGGQNWDSSASPAMGGTFDSIWGNAANDIYVTGAKGPTRGPNSAVVRHSTDFGKTWVAVESPAIGRLTSLRGIWGSGRNDVYVAGNGGKPNGEVLRSVDGGKTWSSLLTSKVSSFWTVFGGPGNTELFAPAFDGNIFRSLDRGQNWTPTKIPTSNLGVMWGDGKRYYLAGKTPANAVTMLRSLDRGATWQQDALPSGAPSAGSFTFMHATQSYVYAVGGDTKVKPFLLRAKR
jgi:photosystem II stability/assembly factor-like uncharacterized protein